MTFYIIAAFGWSAAIVAVVYTVSIVKRSNQYLRYFGDQLKSVVALNKEAITTIELQQQTINELTAQIKECEDGN